MKKRFLAMFLALCLTLALLPTAALAANAKEGDTTVVAEGGTYTLSNPIIRIEPVPDNIIKEIGDHSYEGAYVVPAGTIITNSAGEVEYICSDGIGTPPELEIHAGYYYPIWDSPFLVFYGSDESDTTPNQPAEDVAHASAQTVTVDGKPVEFQMYALKDANGNDTNYIKLRDMAYVLNGTKAQFSVGYNAQDKTITATTGAAYEEDGTEMKSTFGGADKEYVKTTLTIQLDGKPVQLEAITLTDDAGGGYNYCKVRDLGQTFNFNVDWKAGVGIYIESDKPYGG